MKMLCMRIAVAVSLAVAGSNVAIAESFSINGNGHAGILQFTRSGDHITGTIYGNPIEGFVTGRRVVFYRASSRQIWNGWIWSDNHGPDAGRFALSWI